MSDYHVWSTTEHVTKQQAADIDAAVKRVDPGMDFVRYYAAGNSVHGWLARNDDGTNDHPEVRRRNAQCIAIAEDLLGISLSDTARTVLDAAAKLGPVDRARLREILDH